MSFPAPPPPDSIFPPLPPLPPIPYDPYPTWSPPPRRSNNNGATVAGVTIAFGFFVLALSVVCRLARKDNPDGADGAGATEAATTALAARPRAPPPSSVQVPPETWYSAGNGQQLRPPGGGDGDEGRRPPRRVGLTERLPSFTYSRSAAMHNATGGGGGDEATTCSVCLGAFEAGETVRLLPVCLHLFHVECIDPWLDMHATCPICRSGTDPTAADGRLHHPPV